MALYIALAVAIVVGLAVAAHLLIQRVIVPMVLTRLGRPIPPPSGGWIVLRRRGAPRR